MPISLWEGKGAPETVPASTGSAGETGQCHTCAHPPACHPLSPTAIAQWLGTTALLREGQRWVQAATTTTAQRTEQQQDTLQHSPARPEEATLRN